ncbi:MAG: carboxymuconolactone decarboxylase family protein [Spirochaetes bacterium]|nr:carboxymuconolactone decarboxylase family protein [Spirochaetota bacterium]MBU1080372.1 carboxymuconolactone decarboxylase family protein [Spirochaetota bacterium]
MRRNNPVKGPGPSSAPAFLPEPPRLAWPLRLLLGAVERSLGKRLVANRILGWYPKALLGSGLLEAFIAHDEPEAPRRLLAMIRLFVSFRVSCAFCIDMNALRFEEAGLSEAEVGALRLMAAGGEPAVPGSFSEGELAALRYAASATSTPVAFDAGDVALVRELYGERGMVIVASTAAQVNFWARLIQSLGVAPAGFSEGCAVLRLDEYGTVR